MKEKGAAKIVRKSASKRKAALKAAPEKPRVAVKRISAFYDSSSKNGGVFYKEIRSALIKIMKADRA